MNACWPVVSSPTEADSLVEIDPNSGKTTLLRKSTPIAADPAYTSIPQAIEFPTTNGKTAHAFY